MQPAVTVFFRTDRGPVGQRHVSSVVDDLPFLIGLRPGRRWSSRVQAAPKDTAPAYRVITGFYAYHNWLPDYKPVSVPLRAVVIHLDRPLLAGSSDLPGSFAERAAPPPLFGLAPRGVYPASGIAPTAVRSYRTISPLPDLFGPAVYFLWHFPYPFPDPGR